VTAGPSAPDEVERQRTFYRSGEHDHLRARDDDRYARKLARELARRAGIEAHHRVLEIGAGFGRFTFPLLEHCGSVVAFDLSERVLADLATARDLRGIAEERCRTLCGDVEKLDPSAGPFDFVVGFFILHHLPDVPAAIRALVPALSPRGGMAFIEPNRRNPLFLAQVLFCPDMPWREERGMFRLSARKVEAAFGAATLAPRPTERFGFFPPQVYNHLAPARALESGVERVRAFQPVLPFLFLSARREGADRDKGADKVTRVPSHS
jgi:SAM-dependent methyltransferase